MNWSPCARRRPASENTQVHSVGQRVLCLPFWHAENLRVKKGQTMLEQLQLGNTTIHVQDDEFAHGWQVGYFRFKKDFQGKVSITDELLCTLVAHTFIDVYHPGRYNAGYLIGFVSALIEKQPEQRRQAIRMLPFVQP
jgi:hypothetical protein